MVHLGGARHHGLRPAHSHGRAGRAPRPACRQYRRGRLLRDEQPGAGHVLRREAAREDGHHQQQRAWHGPAVATHHLQGALLRHRSPWDPRLGEAGGGIWLRGAAGDQAQRGGAGHREDAEHARAGDPRRVRRQGRMRLPDGPRRRRQHRHDPGAADPRGPRPGREVADGVLRMSMNGTEPRKHTISVLVENKFGVLSRVAGLFSARGYNIESLSVGETLDPSVSRMTLVVSGDEFVIEQVTKQLHKLIDVIKVNDLTDESHVERELMLIRVNAEPQHREEILRTADIFRAKVVDVTQVSFVLEATGDEGKLEALVELLRPMGIQEIVRTGKVAIVADAAKAGDVVMILLPDQTQRQVFEESIRKGLGKGKMLMFAHGFNIHFNQVVPPPDVDVTMIAPKAPGHVMRDLFTQGPGVPALVAVQQDVTGKARDLALAYGRGVGCTRAGVIETTFKEETETDVFGEQTTLCVGVAHLI